MTKSDVIRIKIHSLEPLISLSSTAQHEDIGQPTNLKSKYKMARKALVSQPIGHLPRRQASAAVSVFLAVWVFLAMALPVQSFTVTRNNHVTSLSISTTRQQTTAYPAFTRQSVLLEATSSGGKKKRRRRRKQPPAGGDSSPSPPAPAEKATPKQSPKPVAETVQVDIDDVSCKRIPFIRIMTTIGNHFR